MTKHSLFKRSVFFLLLNSLVAGAADTRPVYTWFEPEWFEGIDGDFSYWNGPASYNPTGKWGIAGPGISAEWTQGGESEWQSVGAPPSETKAECHRDFVVPRSGKHRVWVRYVDHRNQAEPFTVTIQQGDRKALTGELGTQPVVPPNDEYQLYWGFSFGWGSLEGELKEGPARISLEINKAGDGWRQLDAVLITDDLAYRPYHREKPPFAYFETAAQNTTDGAGLRGSAKGLQVGANWKRNKVGPKDFSMWVFLRFPEKWWSEQKQDSVSPYDMLLSLSPPPDILGPFAKQFADAKDVPLVGWPDYFPGFYLGDSVDLSPSSPLGQWLTRTKSPFFIGCNYATPAYTETTGPGTFAALSGPLAGQFLGYTHGEAVSWTGPTGPIKIPSQPLGKTRREHVDATIKQFIREQKEQWKKIYKCEVPENHWNKGISCLSCLSIAMSHLFCESGVEVLGFEMDSTNINAPLRIAFERGAARQYGRAWINYASANFGDACNYFTQVPIGQRGAQSWFHSKYAVTDGVSATWYRKYYFLNYLGGASAIFLEQSLNNQWILPGPGTHPIQLSPFGRVTQDFQDFVSRLPDRGEPYTPVAILLSYGHGYDRLNYVCKMLDAFPEDRNDIELRELFNVCWYPVAITEGQPQSPDLQSLPNGIYGNIFDFLVDRPARIKAIFDYPIVWAAGDVELAPLQATIEEYVKKGGTLVLNVQAAKGLSPKLLGVKPGSKTTRCETWTPAGGEVQTATPFEVVQADLSGAEALVTADGKHPLVTRNKVGDGMVILTLVPHLVGQDERAHPAIPYLMNALTDQLLPVEVRSADGSRPKGEILYQLNRTADGYVVLLMNNLGIDKTQNGVARVDRRKFVDVVLRTKLGVKSAKEYTQPRDLKLEKSKDVTEIRIRVEPGDVQVVGLVIR